MSNDWGPHFIVPSETLKKFSGSVLLRESYDPKLLRQELESLGMPMAVVRINNPWYYRKKGTETWIAIGESDDENENFPVRWDTTDLENGEYQVLGLMHVYLKEGNEEMSIARQGIVDVTIEH